MGVLTTMGGLASTGSGVSAITTPNAGLIVSEPTGNVILTLGELTYGTLWGEDFTLIETPAEGDFLYFNGTTWVPGTVSGGGGIQVNTGTGGVTIVNEGVTSLTAGTGISLGGGPTGAISVSNAGVVELNSETGTVVLSSTNTGITVTNGSGTIKLALGELDNGTLWGKPFNAETPSATSNQIVTWAPGDSGFILFADLDIFSLDSVTFSFTTLSSGHVLTYNGTNWTNKTPGARASAQWTNAGGSRTSTSTVMMGIGQTSTITPTLTGKVMVTITFQAQFGDSGPYAIIIGDMYVGTSTAPSSGASVTGTASGGSGTVSQVGSGITATWSNSVSYTALFTGLTVGDAYWFDLSYSVGSTGSGGFSVLKVTGVAVEVG